MWLSGDSAIVVTQRFDPARALLAATAPARGGRPPADRRPYGKVMGRLRMARPRDRGRRGATREPTCARRTVCT
jgi:hypothetical protein